MLLIVWLLDDERMTVRTVDIVRASVWLVDSSSSRYWTMGRLSTINISAKISVFSTITIIMSQRIYMCGHVKSGNSLLHKTLREIVTYKGVYNSYINEMRTTSNHSIDKTLFMGYSEIDDIQLINHRFQYSQLNIEHGAPEEIDINRMNSFSSIIWCHDKIEDIHISTFLKNNIRTGFYLVRNPFEVIKSLAQHTINRSSYIDAYKIRDLETLLAREDIITRWAHRWVDHVETYFKYSTKFAIIKYEELVSSKLDTLHMIFSHLKMDTPTQDYINIILHNTSKETMKKESPIHVGMRNTEIDFTNTIHNSIFEITKNSMARLNYNEI